MKQTPTEKQTAFLLADAKEILYGGAAGGAKSSGLLMAALQYVDVPGYSAILFRRTYADLSKPGALMDRTQDWLANTDARWNAQNHLWRFPSGATLSFGHLENEKAKYDYQSAEFQFVGFDELTHFSETQYRYLFSRLRRLKVSTVPLGAKAPLKVPLRMRAGSNPGGDGHEWVYRRFIAPHIEAEKRRVELGRKALLSTRRARRVFIPSKLEDNPHLDKKSYEESLDELDPVTRKQLRHGDWNVKQAGEYFKRAWFRIVDIAPSVHVRWVRFWDFAATEETRKNKNPDWCVGTLMGIFQGEYFIKDVVRWRKNPAETEAEIERIVKGDGIEVVQHFEQEPGASAKLLLSHFQRNLLAGYAVYGHTMAKQGDKVTRAKPLSAACSQRRVVLVRGDWNSGWFDRMESFPLGDHDDETDSASGAYNQLHESNGGQEVPEPAEAERTGLSGMEM